MRKQNVEVRAVTDLEAAARAADVISCATLATEPLICGAWLASGTHLDLVGGFKPSMREADDEAVRRATVYVDTRAGALKEAGDIADPLRRGILSEADIAGDLFDLCRGTAAGRHAAGEITCSSRSARPSRISPWRCCYGSNSALAETVDKRGRAVSSNTHA